MKPKIFTVATAHLDTSWLWTFETTVSEYLPDTIKRNFEFFEKYPEYKFNFEGSLRYELIKEYYPEDYKKLCEYIKKDRWHPCGACYENGDVNIPSPEALTRNILYGRHFFRNEFGYESNDIFLPDCFGFGKALPTVAAHSGVKGFSTGKLFWGSSVPIPFDTGKWIGADGSFLWSALMPFSYTTAFRNMSKAERLLEKLENCKKRNLPEFTFGYHGNGDRGGAPYKNSVKNVIKAQRKNNENDIEVFSASTKEFFECVDNLPEETKSVMPEYNGEFLLTEHGVGSYTSRTVTKRWNRRSELLADSAERFSSAALIHGYADYPQKTLDDAWKKVLAHHFHDDITGTSFEECYKRSHNDYVQAMNAFSAEYIAACKSVAARLDTSFCKGIPIIVSNPVQCSDYRTAAAKVTLKTDIREFSVYDCNGNEVPSQTTFTSADEATVTFLSKTPSCGLSVYDLRYSKTDMCFNTGLRCSVNHLENSNLKVKIDDNGDICSIFDKILNKELLAAPIRLSLQNNTNSINWPAWEIKYADISSVPYSYPHSPTIRVSECGPVQCSLEIIRKSGKSEFRQTITLDCSSRYISIYNETDWQEEAALLKAEFRLSAADNTANYDIGIGYTGRNINSEKLYEVPAQKWADITDKNGNFGVSVFSDSRTGWDHPDKNTLRLTLIHTPLANYRWECSQHIMDMGLNRYSYAIMGHEGLPDTVSHYAELFCQPVHTFITDKHSGESGTEFSLVKVNDDRVRISAIKKAQDSDRLILRVADCSSNDIENASVSFSLPIKQAYEVTGDESITAPYDIINGYLQFKMQKNSLRSFALEFDCAKAEKDEQQIIALPFNEIGITSDSNRNTSTLKDGLSIPSELLPEKLLYAGISYRFSTDGLNCTSCKGQTIYFDDEYSVLHLLLTSLNGDKAVKMLRDGKTEELKVFDCLEAIGQWDIIREQKTGYIKNCENAYTVSHSHSHTENLIGKQLHIFHCSIKLNGSRKIQLPYDENIIIFAATAEKKSNDFVCGDEHYDSLSRRTFSYELSDYAKKLMNPNRLEMTLNKFIDSSTSMNMLIGEFYNKYTLNELYNIFRTINNRLHYKENGERIKKNRS